MCDWIVAPRPQEPLFYFLNNNPGKFFNCQLFCLEIIKRAGVSELLSENPSILHHRQDFWRNSPALFRRHFYLSSGAPSSPVYIIPPNTHTLRDAGCFYFFLCDDDEKRRAKTLDSRRQQPSKKGKKLLLLTGSIDNLSGRRLPLSFRLTLSAPCMYFACPHFILYCMSSNNRRAGWEEGSVCVCEFPVRSTPIWHLLRHHLSEIMNFPARDPFPFRPKKRGVSISFFPIPWLSGVWCDPRHIFNFIFHFNLIFFIGGLKWILQMERPWLWWRMEGG
jgi:hypothetical protein